MKKRDFPDLSSYLSIIDAMLQMGHAHMELFTHKYPRRLRLPKTYRLKKGRLLAKIS